MTPKYTKSRGRQRSKEKKVVRTFSHIIGLCHRTCVVERQPFFVFFGLFRCQLPCQSAHSNHGVTAVFIYYWIRRKKIHSKKQRCFRFFTMCKREKKIFGPNSSRRRRSRVVNSCSRCGKCYWTVSYILSRLTTAISYNIKESARSSIYLRSSAKKNFFSGRYKSLAKV